MKTSITFHIYVICASALLCPQLARAHSLRHYDLQQKNATQTLRQDAHHHLMREAPEYHLIKADHKCGSTDDFLGIKLTLQECATAVKADGGKFFIFGKAGSEKAGACMRENTVSVSCAEGLMPDTYDFYSLTLQPTEAPSVTSTSTTAPVEVLSGPNEAEKRSKYAIVEMLHQRIKFLFGRNYDEWYMDWKLWVGLACWWSVVGRWSAAGYEEIYLQRFTHCFGINVFILHWLQYASSNAVGMLAVNIVLTAQCFHLNFIVYRADVQDAAEGSEKERGEIGKFTCETMYLDLSLPLEQITVLFLSQTIVWWFYMSSIIANFDLAHCNYMYWLVAFLTMQMTMIFCRGDDSVLGSAFPVHDVHRLIANANDVQFDLEETEDDPPFQVSKTNVILRGLFGFICNTILRDIMSYTIPLMLMGFSEPMDFVVYCVGVNFICTLDDMKEKHFNMTLVPWSSRSPGAES